MGSMKWGKRRCNRDACRDEGYKGPWVGLGVETNEARGG